MHPGFPSSSSLQRALGAPKVRIFPSIVGRKKDLQHLRPSPSAVLCLQGSLDLESSPQDQELPKTCIWDTKLEYPPLKILICMTVTI